MRTWLANWLIARYENRDPDFVIGGWSNPYLLRWYLIPRNRLLNIYLHNFWRSDDDRATHTHPWLFNISVLLQGRYREWFPDAMDDREAGQIKFRWGSASHRIELTHGQCWTLFITGPKVREWGFDCPQGFVHWRDFTSPADKGAVGRGCDQ